MPALQPSGSAPPQQQQPLAAATGDGPASFLSQYTENPYFTAGFGLAAIATAARIGQKGLQYGAFYLRRRMLVDLEITYHDKAYPWVLQWMTQNHRAQLAGLQVAADGAANTQPGGPFQSLLRRFSPRMHHLQLQTSQLKQGDGVEKTHFSVMPGQGKHIIRYGNAWMMVSRERAGQAINMANGTPFESIKFTTLYAHRHMFERLILEAKKLADDMEEGKTILYFCRGMDWEKFGEPKRKRPLDSVVLEEGIKERLVQDIQDFINARVWYLDRGIPYRRGYLLHGPPGTGKSSFIEALAGHLNFNIAMLNVSQRGLTDDKLQYLLTKVPPRSFVLLEDADAAWVNRTQTDESGYAGATVTFSGLLNALDGVASAEERIIFLTTNHVERLDDALIRPGRIDVTVRIGEATEWQMARLWDRFYAEADGDGAGRERFMAKVRGLGLVNATSPAELQGLFLHNKEKVDGAIAGVDELASAHARRARKAGGSED